MNAALIKNEHDLLLPLTVWILLLALRLFLRKTRLLQRAGSGRHKAFLSLLPVLDLLLVLYLALWTGFFFLRDHPSGLPITVIGVLLLIIGLGWFALADMAAGFVFRLETPLRAGDIIVFEGKEGRVHHIGIRNLVIARPDSLQLKIPYRCLTNRPFETPKQKQDEQSHTFRLPLNGRIAKNAADRLRAAILNSPWVVPNSEPVIRSLPPAAGNRELQVSVRLLDMAYAAQFENSILSLWLAAAAGAAGGESANPDG